MKNERILNTLQNVNINNMYKLDQNLIRSKSYNCRPRNNRLIKSANICNYKNNYQNKNNINYKRYYTNNNDDIFDMRIYYCLKMLGLDYLQNIFEKKNITFDKLLILSTKDLYRLGLEEEEQEVIKQFSLDYIKNGSYYSLEELQNYFKFNKNKYRFNRTIISIRDSNKVRDNIMHSIKKKNNLRNDRSNENIRNKINYYNSFNKRYNSYSSREKFFTINNIGNHRINYLSNNDFSRRNNSANVHNIKNLNLNIKNNINYNTLNNKYNNNIRRKLTQNYMEINGTSTNDSIFSLDIDNNINNYNNYNYYNNGYYTLLNFKNNMTNFNLAKNKTLDNYNFIYNNNLEKNTYFTKNRNFSNQNKKTKQLNEFKKKKVNSILTNKLNSLKRKGINKNPYIKNRRNTSININDINNKDFKNEQEFKMFFHIEKMKNNKLYNNNSLNDNITNTKINNYINNIYSINKDPKNNNNNNRTKIYKEKNKQNKKNITINNWRASKNKNNILKENSFYNVQNKTSNINDFIFNKNLTINNGENIYYNNFEKELFQKRNQNNNRNTLSNYLRKNNVHIKSINNIGSRSQKNCDLNTINMYNYYKINNSVKNKMLNSFQNINAYDSIDIKNNNYNKKYNYYDGDENSNNIQLYTYNNNKLNYMKNNQFY